MNQNHLPTLNKVSECCYREVYNKAIVEYPLGGNTWSVTGTERACVCCGLVCSEVDQCEVCGVVGCLGDCEEPPTATILKD